MALISHSTSKKKTTKFKVGDRVLVHFGAADVLAEVIEDRGNLGVGGRQLLRIQRLDMEPELFGPFEVRAENVELVSSKPVSRKNGRQK